jgi:hypothetical protein
MRVGAEVLFYPQSTRWVAPWIGASAGLAFGESRLHEARAVVSTAGSGVVTSISDPGFGSRAYELAVQLGGDVRVTERVAVGPYATVGATRAGASGSVTRAEGGIRLTLGI